MIMEIKQIDKTNNKGTFCITRAMGFLFDDDIDRLWKEPDLSIYPHCFKLYDGDNTLYFVGYSQDDSSFDPVDDYGINYGVVTIKYYNKQTKTWDIL